MVHGEIMLKFAPIPVSVQTATSQEYFERFVQSFRQGFDVIPILIGMAILLGIMLGLYGLYVALGRPGSRTGSRQIPILEALENNIRLSESQNRYLEALIEQFKNRQPHDPEISNKYLRKFFVSTVQRLTNAPTKTLRRQTNHIPDLEPGSTVTLMVQDENVYESYECELGEQDEEYLMLSPPDDVPFVEGDEVEVSCRRNRLVLRGDAEVREIDAQRIILHLNNGMHFEEQRRYFRLDTDSLPCRLKAKTEEEGTQLLKGTVEDLSLEGARVQVENPPWEPRNGVKGTLTFDLPEHRTMNLPVEIVRVNNNEEQAYEFGLYFYELRMGDREHLAQYIHDHQPRK